MSNNFSNDTENIEVNSRTKNDHQESVKSLVNDVDPQTSALMSKMLQRRIFVAISTPVADGPDIRIYLKKHLQHQIELEKEGVLAAAGPFLNVDMAESLQGMFIIRARSQEEARCVLDADPLHAHGVRNYTLYEWQINEGRVGITIDFSDQSYDIT